MRQNKIKKKIYRDDSDMPYEWGTEELTVQLQRPYAIYFNNAPGTVLEIGCGRGFFLELLINEGIDAYGLDASEETVRYCTEKDLRVVCDDAIKHLSSLPSASLGGIFCGHVIEHIQPQQAVIFIDESYRVLKPDGNFVIITPNAKDLRTTERFWLDITHVRPYPEKLLVALLRKSGYKKISAQEGAEPYKNPYERFAKWILRKWFMGYLFRGDLVVIATR